jgi:hypothetical protein
MGVMLKYGICNKIKKINDNGNIILGGESTRIAI